MAQQDDVDKARRRVEGKLSTILRKCGDGAHSNIAVAAAPLEFVDDDAAASNTDAYIPYRRLPALFPDPPPVAGPSVAQRQCHKVTSSSPPSFYRLPSGTQSLAMPPKLNHSFVWKSRVNVYAYLENSVKVSEYSFVAQRSIPCMNIFKPFGIQESDVIGFFTLENDAWMYMMASEVSWRKLSLQGGDILIWAKHGVTSLRDVDKVIDVGRHTLGLRRPEAGEMFALHQPGATSLD
ncbi:hypothetical protein BKA93DRAFT_821254 [Sparassis latifolia]